MEEEGNGGRGYEEGVIILLSLTEQHWSPVKLGSRSPSHLLHQVAGAVGERAHDIVVEHNRHFVARCGRGSQ